MKLLSLLVLVVTITGALSVKCTLKQCQSRCPHGFVDCKTCKCLPAPTATPLPQSTCSPILCLIHCPFGFVKDKNGCKICKCAPRPTTSAPTVLPTLLSSTCAPIRCRILCRYGYKKDANGCEICQCAPRPTSRPTSQPSPSPSPMPSNPCKNITCKAGYTCKLVTVQCIKSPCPKMPQCVSPCRDITCPSKGASCSIKAPFYRPLCSCVYNSQNQISGSKFNATDGCNTCTCRNGTVSCTKKSCSCVLPCPLGEQCQIVNGKQSCVKTNPCANVRCPGGCSVVNGKAHCGCSFNNFPVKYGTFFRANNTCIQCNCTMSGNVRCYSANSRQQRCRPKQFCWPPSPCQKACLGSYAMAKNGSCALCQCSSGQPTSMPPASQSCSLRNGQSRAIGSLWKVNNCTSCRCLPSNSSDGPQAVCVSRACPLVTCKNARVPHGQCCSVCPSAATQPPPTKNVTLCRVYNNFMQNLLSDSFGSRSFSSAAFYAPVFAELANAWPSLPFVNRNISLVNAETLGHSTNFFAPACLSDGSFSATQCFNVSVMQNGNRVSVVRCLCVDPATGDPSSLHRASSALKCPAAKTTKCQKERAMSLIKLFMTIASSSSSNDQLKGATPRPTDSPRPSASPTASGPSNSVVAALRQITNQFNVFVPNCRADYNFTPRQCSGNQCWCVNPMTGVEIANTRGPARTQTRCSAIRPTRQPPSKPSTPVICPSIKCKTPCSNGRAVDAQGCPTCKCLAGKCDVSSVMSCFSAVAKPSSSVGTICNALQQAYACFKKANVNGAFAGCSAANNATISNKYGQLRMNMTKLCKSKKQCTYGGRTRMNGDQFPSLDGCNTCSCNSGEVSCTEKACQTPAYCVYDGNRHSVGDNFDALDGCNECSCSEDGKVTCGLDPCKTTKYLKSTVTFEADYNQLITDDSAKEQFKMTFASSLAKALGISVSQIYVISISSGSIVVESAIQGSNLTAVEVELDSVISSNQFTLTFGNERLTASNLRYSYSKQTGALPTSGDDNSGSGVSIGLIIGVSVAGAVAVVFLIIMVVLIVNRNRKSKAGGVGFVNQVYSSNPDGEVKLSSPLYDNPE